MLRFVGLMIQSTLTTTPYSCSKNLPYLNPMMIIFVGIMVQSTDITTSYPCSTNSLYLLKLSTEYLMLGIMYTLLMYTRNRTTDLHGILK